MLANCHKRTCVGLADVLLWDEDALERRYDNITCANELNCIVLHTIGLHRCLSGAAAARDEPKMQT